MTEDKLYFGINGMLKTDLCHYGVKGQKWGVRRYQNPDGTLTPEGKKRYAQMRKNSKVEVGHRITPGRMGLEQLKLIGAGLAGMGGHFGIGALASAGILPGVAAAAVPAIGGAVGLASAVQQQAVRNMKVTKEFKNKHDGPVKTIDELKRKPRQMSADEDAKQVNPRGLVGTRGTYKNCAYCSLALDMRRRGYDVRARVSEKGMTNLEIAANYENAEFQKVKLDTKHVWNIDKSGPTNAALREIGDKIESLGPGKRGVVTISYAKMNSGHAMYFENDADGKLTIYDGQSKKKDPVDVFACCNPNSVTILRTDNLKPKESICERVTDWTKSDRKEAEKNANS